MVNVCTWPGSSYIRLFGAYAWGYLSAAIVSVLCCATIGTTIIDSEHSIIRKAIIVSKNTIANCSIFETLLENTKEAKGKYPIMSRLRRINITVQEKQKIKKMMTTVSKCCFAGAALCVFLLIIGGVFKVKALKSYHGPYGTSYDIFSANTGGYVLELLNLRELQIIVGDWAQFVRPIARYMPEILVIGALLFSCGLMLNNWLNNETRPIIIGWLIMAVICYGLHFFSIQVNKNYADWVSVREYLFPSLANRDKFWSAVIVNNGRLEGYFYKRDSMLNIAFIAFVIMLLISLIYWVYSGFQKKQIVKFEDPSNEQPVGSEEDPSQIIVEETIGREQENAGEDQNAGISQEMETNRMQEANSELHSNKEFTEMLRKREITNVTQNKKVRRIIMILFAFIVIAFLFGRFRNVTFERKYSLTDGYNGGYIELHNDGTYYMSLGWYGSLEGTYRSNGRKLWIKSSDDENQLRTLEFEVHDEYLVITTSGFDNERLYRDTE